VLIRAIVIADVEGNNTGLPGGRANARISAMVDYPFESPDVRNPAGPINGLGIAIIIEEPRG